MATIATEDLPRLSDMQDGGARRPAQIPKKRGWLFWGGVVLTVIYMVIVALMTMWPTHIDSVDNGGTFAQWLARGHTEGWMPLWVTYGAVEWCSNVVMFMPGGFLFCLLLRISLRVWVPFVGMLTSVGIEVIQLFLPDRTSSLLDILANSLGAFVGWILGLLVLKVYKILVSGT